MRRLAALAPFVALLVAAPAALAHDGGQGWYGVGRRQGHDERRLHPDHLLPGLHPVMSLLQGHLEKRKERRKAAEKELSGDWRGGW